MVGEHPACISTTIDSLVQPIYDKFGVCFDMNTIGYRLDENGNPLIEDCQTRMFTDYYSTKQSMQAFKSLYTNRLGLQDKFVDYWDVTSARLTNNPYVVGFDPLNEPFPGEPLQDPKLIIPGVMDKTQLAPMYERVYERYKANDAESIMWFEPAEFPDWLPIGNGLVSPVGF